MRSFCAVTFVAAFLSCTFLGASFELGIPVTEFRVNVVIILGSLSLIAAIGWIDAIVTESNARYDARKALAKASKATRATPFPMDNVRARPIR